MKEKALLRFSGRRLETQRLTGGRVEPKLVFVIKHGPLTVALPRKSACANGGIPIDGRKPDRRKLTGFARVSSLLQQLGGCLGEFRSTTVGGFFKKAGDVVELCWGTSIFSVGATNGYASKLPATLPGRLPIALHQHRFRAWSQREGCR